METVLDNVWLWIFESSYLAYRFDHSSPEDPSAQSQSAIVLYVSFQIRWRAFLKRESERTYGLRIGIDVGGTFTDLVAMDEGDSTPVAFKTPTTPADPSDGVLKGIAGLASSMGMDARELLKKAQVIIHGTTVATNTLVERKGANVGLITTEGFRDLLEIREGLKEDRYNLRMDQVEPLAPRYLRVGVAERVDSSGRVRRKLDVEGLRHKVEYLKAEGVDSVAICFLFSFLNPDHEMEAERIVREMLPDAYVSARMSFCRRSKSLIGFPPLL